MSIQVSAPPNREEDTAIQAAKRRRQRSGAGQVVTTWSEDGGWCSACKTEHVLVAHMGTEDFNFALCKVCIDTLQTEIATEQTGAGEKEGA